MLITRKRGWYKEIPRLWYLYTYVTIVTHGEALERNMENVNVVRDQLSFPGLLALYGSMYFISHLNILIVPQCYKLYKLSKDFLLDSASSPTFQLLMEPPVWHLILLLLNFSSESTVSINW